MIKKNLKLIPLLFFSIGIIEVHAQQAVLSAGGDAAGTGGSASYSIGQISYNAFTTVGGYITEGVQQPVISTALPLSVLNLQAIKQEDKVLLKWETVLEINTRNFIIQRSKDGLNFSDLSELLASGNSTIKKSYSKEDTKPLSGAIFYRIKQVDNDGSFMYSKTISVNFSLSESIAVVYPNPATDQVTLKVGNYNSHSFSYKLFDGKGQLLLASKIIDNLTFVRIGNLSAANYFLKIIDNNIEVKTFKIIKTK